MTVKSFGKIAVVTPGIPVPVCDDPTLQVAGIRFASVIGESGRTFLGTEGMNRVTGAGVVKEFWPTGGGGGVADALMVEEHAGGNVIRPSEYWVDANNAGEGLIVAYWVR